MWPNIWANPVNFTFQLDDRPDHAGNFAADVAEMGKHPATAAWLRVHSSPARGRAAALLGASPARTSEPRTPHGSRFECCARALF